MGINQTRGPIVEGDQTKPLDRYRYQTDRYRLYVTLGMFLYPLAIEQCTANIAYYEYLKHFENKDKVL